MNFNLKRPCANCPFLKKGAIELAPGRVEGIMADIAHNDYVTFQCHKTTYGQAKEVSACIGATVWQRKRACLSVGARLALAVRILTLEQLDKLAVEIVDDPVPAQRSRRRKMSRNAHNWRVTMPRAKPAPGEVNFVAAIRRSNGSRMELSHDAANEAHALQAWNLMHMNPANRDALTEAIRALRSGSAGDSTLTEHQRELLNGFTETIPSKVAP